MTVVEPLNFGALVRQHRIAAGLTQEALAGRAGVSVEAVSALERGVRRAPRMSTVQLLADALALAGDDKAAFMIASREQQRGEDTATPVRLEGILARPRRIVTRGRDTQGVKSAARLRGSLVAALIVALVVGGVVLTLHAQNGRHTARLVPGRLDHHWPRPGTAISVLDNPRGIAVARSGDVYVADTGNNRIDRFSAAGLPLASFGTKGTAPGQFLHPRGIAVDASGNIYVADTGNDRIQKLSPAGAPLASWGRRGVLRGEFRSPLGIALSPIGDVLIADWGNNRVQEISPRGKVLASFESEFTGPEAVVVDAQNNIYVADDGPVRLHEISTTDGQVTRWGASGIGPGEVSDPTGIAVASNGDILVTQDIGTPVLRYAVFTHVLRAWHPESRHLIRSAGLAVRGSRLYLLNISTEQVDVLNSGGRLLNTWGSPPLKPPGIGSPRSLAVGPHETIYVADAKYLRVLTLTPDGRPAAQLNRAAVGYPVAVASDAQGDLFVLDAYHYRIREFAPGGRRLLSFGHRRGSGIAGRLSDPAGLAVDTHGHVYISDAGTGTVQRFTKAGKFLSVWTVAVPGSPASVGAIAVAPHGTVYVALPNRAQILKLSSTGLKLARWGSPGHAPGEFLNPTALATDSRGNLYVADTGNHRIQVLSPRGRVVRVIGGPGPRRPFDTPDGIAVDSRLHVFVADAALKGVRRLTAGRYG